MAKVEGGQRQQPRSTCRGGWSGLVVPHPADPVGTYSPPHGACKLGRYLPPSINNSAEPQETHCLYNRY